MPATRAARPNVTLRARWLGPAPSTGEYLKAPKGRFAYRIVTVARISRTNARRYRFIFTCERADPQTLPQGAIIHAWRWDRRQSRRQGN